MPENPCPYHDRLQADITDVQKTVHRIDQRLGKGDVLFGKFALRLGIVEKVVYGGVALVLLTVAGAVLRNIL